MAFSAELEAKTVQAMIEMYCNNHHNTRDKQLCPACTETRDYALVRIKKCPFGEDKPVCSSCQVHCYKTEQREQIRIIMRYAGPRMLGRHPLLAIRYLYRKRFKSQKTKL